MTIILHGIPNCDTVRKARGWLAAAGIDHRFHDLRRDGLTPAMLDRWIAAVGWEKLLNRSGTTFRSLDPADREGLDADKAIALMLAHPALVRRPVLEGAGPVTIGFRPELYEGLFA